MITLSEEQIWEDELNRLAHVLDLQRRQQCSPALLPSRLLPLRANECYQRFNEACRGLELSGWDRQRILRITEPIRTSTSAVQFLHHIRTWPHGYPGDWEIIEHIMDDENKSEPESWAWYLERSALHLPIVQQHREKVRWQANAICNVLSQVRGPVRILSLATGGGRDLWSARTQVRHYEPELVLNDLDAHALAVAQKRAQKMTGRYRTIQGNALQVARQLRGEKPFDLVLAGGLFDYLPDRAASLLIRMVMNSLLGPGGRLVLTNIESGNRFRPLMEYMAAWYLIERSEADVLRLCAGAGIHEDTVEIERDPTGLTLLVNIKQRGK